MQSFRFTDQEWTKISSALSALGRLDCESNRWTLEMICWGYAALRPKRGRDRFVPTVARDAWLRVAAAAAELDEAIRGLPAAGAADFTMVDNQGGAAMWSNKLSTLVEDAQWAAELEVAASEPCDRADGHNIDPMLDGLVQQLIRVWESFGGHPSADYNDSAGNACGALIRFLTVTTTAARGAAARRPVKSLTPEKIQSLIGNLINQSTASDVENI